MSKLEAAKNKRKKNFLPALILAIVFWGFWGWVVYSSVPESGLTIFLFYLLLFASVFFTTALAFGNSNLGLLSAFWVIIFLNFRFFKIGNVLNLSLLTIIFLLLGFYLFRRKT
jgi:hypothetical protein